MHHWPYVALASLVAFAFMANPTIASLVCFGSGTFLFVVALLMAKHAGRRAS